MSPVACLELPDEHGGPTQRQGMPAMCAGSYRISPIALLKTHVLRVGPPLRTLHAGWKIAWQG